ncbi:MAG: dihydrofolate reductase [Paludibacteraceae bacterium]|nr:dihydrofolate reductase [Paludibacteraceae bacterium]
MKKVLCVLLAAMTLLACNKESKQTTPSIEDFPYMVDQFYDLGILRYRVPGFEDLSVQQKALVYYLSEAALWGRDILTDQNCRYNLRIRRVCESVYENYAGDKTTEEWKKFVLYLKRVWFSNGIHHHYSEDKFLPECSREWFVEACKQSNLKEEDYVELLDVMFDPTVLPKKVCSDSGVDLLMNSACNYYEGVTQAEAEAYYAAHKDDSAEPLWIGLNSKLVKDAEGQVVERVYRVEDGGLYSAALAKVVENLEKALPYAETEEQKVVLEKLISFNKTGDLRTFNEYAIAWVKDLQSRVDFVNGFTEVYGDPLGITGAWESLVNYKDLAATERTIKMSENAQWFEDNSPTDPKYKKAECKGVTAKVITAAILAGDCYPATPIGINLPNANWIRKSYGSKSVTIQNLMEAYNEAALGNGFNEEFMLSDKELDYSRRYSALTGDVQVDLHECLGHGSGQLMPGVTKDNLREHGSTLEEARADLFSLYYIADPKLVELGILPDNEAYKAEYYEQMMNGAMTQLVRVEPGKNLEEAHMRNRALIANWVLAHTNTDKPEAEIIVRDCKHYLQINDYEGLRTLYGQLLAIVQEVVSTGDYAQARQLVEDYAVRVDPDLHQEMLARYKPLNIPPYKGFVNPVYTPVMDKEGNITDVTIDYSEGYVEQHLRYSRDYSELPDINR